MTDNLSIATVDELVKFYDSNRHTNPRLCAEIAYAIASLRLKAGDKTDAAQWAQRSIELFQSINISTLDKAACLKMEIGGVLIPELIHDDVVRSRFKEIL